MRRRFEIVETPNSKGFDRYSLTIDDGDMRNDIRTVGTNDFFELLRELFEWKRSGEALLKEIKTR